MSLSLKTSTKVSSLASISKDSLSLVINAKWSVGIFSFPLTTMFPSSTKKYRAVFYWKIKISFSSFFQFGIEQIYRSKSSGRSFCAFVFTSDIFNSSSISRQFESVDNCVFYGLIFRIVCFVLGGQIYLKLYHLKVAPFFTPFLFEVFFV